MQNGVDNIARMPLRGVTVVTLSLNDDIVLGFRSRGVEGRRE